MISLFDKIIKLEARKILAIKTLKIYVFHNSSGGNLNEKFNAFYLFILGVIHFSFCGK